MKAKTFKRAAALVFAAIILLSAISVLTASAKGAAPDSAYWYGNKASWTPAYDDSDPVDHYELSIYNDSGLVATINTKSTDYDCSSIFESSGSGSYYFFVKAAYSDGDSFAYSADVSSDSYEYKVGHEHPLDLVEAKDATCTEDGNSEYYECPVCGMYFSDSKGLNRIEDKSSVKISAKGHDWGEWTTTKEATKTEEGEQTRVCKNDSSHKETRAVAKLGDDAKPADTKPAETTKPVEGTTVPMVTSSNGAVTSTTPTSAAANASNSDNGEKKAVGVTPMTVFLIILGIVLFLVTPGVIILIAVLRNRKKNNGGDMTEGQNPGYYPEGQSPNEYFPNGYRPNPPTPGARGDSYPPRRTTNRFRSDIPTSDVDGYDEPTRIYDPDGDE